MQGVWLKQTWKWFRKINSQTANFQSWNLSHVCAQMMPQVATSSSPTFATQPPNVNCSAERSQQSLLSCFHWIACCHQAASSCITSPFHWSISLSLSTVRWENHLSLFKIWWWINHYFCFWCGACRKCKSHCMVSPNVCTSRHRLQLCIVHW